MVSLRNTMARLGHPHIPIAEGRFTQESGEAAMERLLAEHPDVDGVFAANAPMAMGACHVLREHGRMTADCGAHRPHASENGSACRDDRPVHEPERTEYGRSTWQPAPGRSTRARRETWPPASSRWATWPMASL